MIKNDIQKIFLINAHSKETNNISDEVLGKIDSLIIDKINEENFAKEAWDIYKKFINMKDNAPLNKKNEVFTLIRKLAKDCFFNGLIPEALLLYRFLIIKADLVPDDYATMAEIIFPYNKDIAVNFVELYAKMESDGGLKSITLANFYNFRTQDYKKAIENYEKYIEIDSEKPVVFSILGNLYSKLYGDESLDKQIEYYEKAYSLKPDDRFILHSLAFCYEKSGDNINADFYYKKLLENNPTPTDYYNYGAFLIHNGNFQEGHEYFTKRFEIDDINFKYPSDINRKWDFRSDINDKTLMVHFEQGFGDTIMYCRFVPLLKKLAKKVIFVVQDELCSLLMSSPKISEGIQIVPASEENKIEYDVNIALLDVPYVVGAKSQNLPYCDGYLEVKTIDITNYGKNYINKNKSNIGIAYKGDNDSNYNSRNINSEVFSYLKNNETEVYSLQKDDISLEYNSLGQSFSDFYATACAILNMDLIISTDNVILNLAGALGAKTIGLFNKYTNFRWFKIEDNQDLGWYKSVKALQADSQNDWDTVINKLKTATK